ncbi:MAG: helix-turn-helix domain-containing protein [Lachnospiraceae bacterium]
MEILSKRLRQLRREQDMTQKELAFLLHVQRTTIAGYETKNRHPQLDIIVSIADIFGVTTDYLLGRTDKKY